MSIDTREIRVETSTVCNYRCVMCPRESLSRPQRIMSNALFARIVASARSEFPQLEMCTVSGFGELAADPDWVWKLSLARDLFEQVHVVTNLSLVEPELLEALARNTTEIRVSLYAADDADFRRVHRAPARVSRQSIESKIRRLVELGACVQLTCCELDENRASVRSFVEKWQGLVDRVEVWRPHNWVDGRCYRPQAEDRVGSCGRPLSGPIQVQVDGTVNVCCFDYDGAMVVGDLTRQSFAEIFSGAELSRIRELHAAGRADELPLCRVCDQRDPPERKAAYLVHCPDEATERVSRTSSKRELLRVVQESGAERR